MTDGSELQRKNMEAAARLADLSIENARNVIMLLAQLARTLFQESRSGTERVAAMSDPQEIMTARTEHAQRSMQIMVEGAQKIADIDNEARARFSRLLTEQLVSGNHELMDAFQTYFKFLPAENGDTVKAIETAMSNSRGALAQVAAVASAAGDSAAIVARERPLAACPRVLPSGIVPILHNAEPRAY